MAELSINSELYQQAVTCAQKQGISLTAVIEQLPSRYIESCQQPTGSGDAVSSGESLTTEQRLFCEIRDVVIAERLYGDIGFGRQSIIDRFHFSKNRVGTIFSQGSNYANISDFINDCRLAHACRLLIEKPGMGIGAIATASGFGLRTSFTRSFKQKYGMTPTEFRNQ